MENIYKQATKSNLRFESSKGLRSTEELWDLSLQELDSIYKSLNSQRKQNEEESLLAVKSSSSMDLDLKIEVVKDIVATKIAESKAKVDAASRAAHKQKVLEAIDRKKDSQLADMSLEDLMALANSL